MMEIIIEDLKLSEQYEKLQNENIYLFEEFLDLEKINGSLSILKQFYYDKKNEKYFKIELDIKKSKVIEINNFDYIIPTKKMEEIKLKNKIKGF